MPTGPPPDEVVIEDIREGEGAELEMYRKFTLNYVNFDYETGEQREKVWSPRSLTWDWGYEQLVDGLEIGLEGMRVGGLRELIVPSDLAYNDGARVYLVELLKVF